MAIGIALIPSVVVDRPRDCRVKTCGAELLVCSKVGAGMTRVVDLNSDVGESFGTYRLGADEEVLRLATSANVACGFHAGDPRVMRFTVRLARDLGVAVGAHPGFPDLVGFGRRALEASPDEIEADVIYQVAALDGFCRDAGVALQHVKPHGALYNLAAVREDVAGAVVDAVKAVNPRLVVFALPGSALACAAAAAGLRVAVEAFADRRYNDDGTLVSRRLPNALIRDPEEAAAQAVRIVAEGKIRTITGNDIDLRADTICIHGDGPEAVALAGSIRRCLAEAGVDARALARR